jgi:serine protease Do
MNCRMLSTLGVLAILLTLVGRDQVTAADEPFPEEMLVQLGEPAVYRVVSTNTLVVSMPRSVNVNLEMLQATYEGLVARNQVPAGMTKGQCYCRILQLEPASFLQVSEDRTTGTFSMTGSGSAFAVSREGILLTNAHVIAPTELNDLANNPTCVAQAMSDPLAAIAKHVNEQLGDELQAKSNAAIFSALIQRQLVTVQSREQSIRLFTKVPTFPQMEMRLGRIVPDKEAAEGIPAKVLASGRSYPGRDVAVLRTTRTPANLGVNDPYLLDKDRMVCLRLGDSADVLPGTKIQAFGYPAGAYRDGIMHPDAQRLVSCQNGQIGQIKPLQGDMPVVFEMTADINHGDSGGPVIDKYGRVIGLNVAIYPVKGDGELTMPGHSVAVPIDVAKSLLKAAGIEKLDPGPLTEGWERGLRRFAAQDYAAAEKEFGDLIQLEGGGFGGGLPGIGSPTLPLFDQGNPYVRKLYVLSRKKQGSNLPFGN